MNQVEVQRLAHAVNNLRPTWPISSLTTFISRNLANRNFRDASVALVFVALDQDAAGNYLTLTPKRVLERGDWWKAAEINGTASHGNRQPPKRDQECRLHPGQWSDNCGGCRTDDLAAVYEDEQPAKVQLGRPGDSTAGVAACRASLSGRAGE